MSTLPDQPPPARFHTYLDAAQTQGLETRFLDQSNPCLQSVIIGELMLADDGERLMIAWNSIPNRHFLAMRKALHRSVQAERVRTAKSMAKLIL